jgi:hypothetical protein
MSKANKKQKALEEWTHPITGAPSPEALGLNIKPEEMVFVENIYHPTRLDYIATRALQGLVVGRSDKDRRVAARNAVALAKELIELLDAE